MEATATSTQLIPPLAPGEWTLNQIQEALKRPLPASALETRKQGGATLSYVPWHTVNKILDKYAPGWTWEIRQMTVTGDRLFLVGRLTFVCAEGTVYREATGTELLKEEKPIWVEGENNQKVAVKDNIGRFATEPKELAYGDPSSNAEGMSFRRCAARFGLALYLYDN